jgi:hypothetical protein
MESLFVRWAQLWCRGCPVQLRRAGGGGVSGWAWCAHYHPTELPRVGGQEPQVGLTGGVVQEGIRAAVSALGDVMRHSGDDNACDATHGGKVGQLGNFANVS